MLKTPSELVVNDEFFYPNIPIKIAVLFVYSGESSWILIILRTKMILKPLLTSALLQQSVDILYK